MSRTPFVLFLCTHNAARSQLAEALLRRHAGDRVQVASAGLEPTDVHPFTREVLAEVGVDARGLHAKGIASFLGKVAIDHAIIVCERTEGFCPRVYPFALGTLHWPFPDPTRRGGGPEVQRAAFRRVRDQIDERVRAWLRERMPAREA
jgi:arsenate reductase